MARTLDDFTKALDKNGRQPAVKLEVTPLEGGKPFTISNFNSYHFASNILVPVDTFTFVFRPAMPKGGGDTWDKLVRGGDLVQLTVDDKPLATGFCKVPVIDTDDAGSRVAIEGADMMGYLERSDAVTPESEILYANTAQIGDVLPKIVAGTRIEKLGYETRNIPTDVSSIFATEPGESKLAALQRFLEPLNAIAWTTPTGKLVVGRPAFDSESQGSLGFRITGDGKRRGNCLNMSIRDNSADIPNAVIVVWTGNEGLATVQKQNERRNAAEGPKRLYNAGHKLYRCLPVSAPDANDVKSGLPEVSRLIAQGSNYLGSLAAREFARENTNELIVSCAVFGHLNAKGKPYVIDTCYDIVHDAAGLDEKMYLYSVDYELSEDGGQVTHLSFCKLGTIVADGNSVKAASSDGTVFA